MNPTTRKQAALEGKSNYYTGKPCKHGHIDLREAKSGRCLACCRVWNKEQYDADTDYHVNRAATYREENREKTRISGRKYDAAHRADRIMKSRNRNNQMKTITRKHEQKDINDFYKSAKTKGMSVDHIIALKSQGNLCGLHCIANLQMLELKLNLEKSNKFDPELFPEQILLNTTLDIVPAQFRTALEI